MTSYPTFPAPVWLLLLVLLPAMWWYSHRRLAGLGSVRRWIVLGVRSLVVALFILALAELQIVRTSDRLTVLYLMDQSLSIPEPDREAMRRYVNAAIREHRKDRDRAGVIVFGRDAAVEIPPFDHNVQLDKVETSVNREHTNLAAAMKLALALYKEDCAKRVVVVSDGNQNLGNAAEQAEALRAAGVGIDVLPVRYPPRAELSVDRVTLPPDVRRNQPFDLRVVISNNPSPNAKGDSPIFPAEKSGQSPVSGRLVVTQSAAGRTKTVSDEKIALSPGKNVKTVQLKIDSPNFYTYEAEFIADRPVRDDTMRENNRASGFTQVQGKGRTLVVEDADNPGESDYLAGRLEKHGLEVDVLSAGNFFSRLIELQPYDTVILANVPRDQFSDDQIAMLASNTHQMGTGLVMLGGLSSFGAGGWTNTEIEQALPVDFAVKNYKVVPNGALVLVLDTSSSMAGPKIAMSRSAAIASANTLGERDCLGVVSFDSEARWLLPMRPMSVQRQMLRRLKQLGGGGGTFMYPGMTLGYEGLQRTKAAVKHMIVLTDGQTMGEGYEALAARIHKDNITVTTVAIGSDADVALLDRIARSGRGKFHHVKSLKLLPRIFMKEARSVARSVIFDQQSVRPQIRAAHEILSGLSNPLPPIAGFVLTTKKQNPLVETLLTSPKPSEEENNTVLACWTYGLGRTAAFTSDAGARWTTGWEKQEMYDKFFGQLIRWSMRPAGGTGKFTVTAETSDQQGAFIINALDKDDEYLNFLNMNGRGVGPDMQAAPVKIEQIAPGRYQGTFDAKAPGAYLFMVQPGAGQSPLRFGVNVPYSSEFRDREANEPLLERLAKTAPPGGKPGKLIEAPADAPDPEKALLAENSFRHDLPRAKSSQDAWQYALFLACCLFFTDVFFRRVQIGLEWLKPASEWIKIKIFRRAEVAAQPVPIERLKSTKAEVDGQIEQLRGAIRFEMPRPQKPPDGTVLEEPSATVPKGIPVSTPRVAPEKSEEASYTERLLKAKKKVWDERERK